MNENTGRRARSTAPEVLKSLSRKLSTAPVLWPQSCALVHSAQALLSHQNKVYKCRGNILEVRNNYTSKKRLWSPLFTQKLSSLPFAPSLWVSKASLFGSIMRINVYWLRHFVTSHKRGHHPVTTAALFHQLWTNNHKIAASIYWIKKNIQTYNFN